MRKGLGEEKLDSLLSDPSGFNCIFLLFLMPLKYIIIIIHQRWTKMEVLFFCRPPFMWIIYY